VLNIVFHPQRNWKNFIISGSIIMSKCFILKGIERLGVIPMEPAGSIGVSSSKELKAPLGNPLTFVLHIFVSSSKELKVYRWGLLPSPSLPVSSSKELKDTLTAFSPWYRVSLVSSSKELKGCILWFLMFLPVVFHPQRNWKPS